MLSVYRTIGPLILLSNVFFSCESSSYLVQLACLQFLKNEQYYKKPIRHKPNIRNVENQINARICLNETVQILQNNVF